MRENVTLECLQSVFKGFVRGIIHPTLTRRRKRRSLKHIFLRVRRDVPLPWCLQECWGGGWGQGVCPLVAMAVAVPASPGPHCWGQVPTAPPWRLGSGALLPRESRGTWA